ncbi:MAG: hypothetical protein JWQ11_623, partial [Rhizobacter sp.]|nr:hypothetical protein [Rhizobacter sp.]
MREPKHLIAIAIAAAAAALLAGCAAVGPDYKPPAVPIDEAFTNPGTTPSVVQQPAADIAAFWRGFNDPALNDLIDRAMVANGDVRIAQGRLQEARATLQGAQAALLPEVDVQSSAGRALQPEYLFPGTTRSQRTATLYSGDFVA